MPLGQTNNPNGRTPGSRNKRTEDVWKASEARGDKDPLDFLSALITNEATEAGLRVAAANYILPYKHSKRGPTPAPRYVDDPITIPDFANIQEAQNFLADIARRSGAGELELQSALDVSTLTPADCRLCPGATSSAWVAKNLRLVSTGTAAIGGADQRITISDRSPRATSLE